jgi:hypothetical protein
MKNHQKIPEQAFLATLSGIAALVCAWESWLIHYVNSRPHWLSGPLSVWGYTLSPSVGVAVLGALAILFSFVAVFALCAFKSAK